MKLVVLSDLHLGPPGVAVNGLDPAARLAAAVTAINRDHPDAAFVAIAGDLADMGEVTAYQSLHGLLAPLTMPCHLTLGNHDDPAAFLSVFGAHLNDPEARVSQAIDAGGYRVILLDTTTPGTHGGALCDGRRAWLADQLDKAADRPVIVIMHHHANVLSLPVDAIPLADGAAERDARGDQARDRLGDGPRERLARSLGGRDGVFVWHAHAVALGDHHGDAVNDGPRYRLARRDRLHLGERERLAHRNCLGLPPRNCQLRLRSLLPPFRHLQNASLWMHKCVANDCYKINMPTRQSGVGTLS
jgi:hypothetical protein